MRHYKKNAEFEYPVTTNRIDVEVNFEDFFKKYEIISYSSNGQNKKYLAYEHFGKYQVLSVCGIYARWQNTGPSYTRFFVLVDHGESNSILEDLRNHEDIRSSKDNLENYDERLQKRVVASLAINALGKKKVGKMMYNNGKLIVSDDTNFGISQKRQPLVCVKVEIDAFMNLTAMTESYVHPLSTNELSYRGDCVFANGKYVEGELWEGQSIMPIRIDPKKANTYDLKQLFIRKSRFQDKKNTVPYWPYAKEKYMHGKLFVLHEVVNSTNREFKGLLTLKFHDYQLLRYEEDRTCKEMIALVQETLQGLSVWFEDPFKTDGSKNLIRHFKEEVKKITGNTLTFSKKEKEAEIVIKLCKPKTEEEQESHYSQGMDRLYNSNNVIQHITYDQNEKSDGICKASVERILGDLAVKYALVNEQMPPRLNRTIQGWEFIQYKLHDDNVMGAALRTDKGGKMTLEDIGLMNKEEIDLMNFMSERLRFDAHMKFKGKQEYRVAIKGGNIYMIVDTNEIPVLDANEIEMSYRLVNAKVENEATIARVKRVDNSHLYLRTYMGFHLWKSEGLYQEVDQAYSYTSGIDPYYIKVTADKAIDRLPHVRKIFILHLENKDKQSDDISEIVEMMKAGFGRWDNIMTYPFPFKFLYEYLDNKSELLWSKHWREINDKFTL